MADEHRSERAIRVEKEPFWQAAKRIVLDRRTQMICGLILLTFALVATIAYVSFLFTGAADQSILDLPRAERLAQRAEINNLLGLPGASLAQFMIDGSFGFVSILIVILIGLYALRLMHALHDIPALRWFFSCAFWVIWGSIVLGFTQQYIHHGLFRFGGVFGEAAAAWLVSYVNVIGTVAILVLTLAIFLTVTDPRFIERCRTSWLWFCGLFRRKKKAAPAENADNEPLTIDIPVEAETEKPETEGTEIKLDIESLTPEQEDKKNDEPSFTIDPGASPRRNGESGLRLEERTNPFPMTAVPPTAHSPTCSPKKKAKSQKPRANSRKLPILTSTML